MSTKDTRTATSEAEDAMADRLHDDELDRAQGGFHDSKIARLKAGSGDDDNDI